MGPTLGLETGEATLSLAAMTHTGVVIDFESLASTNGGYNVLSGATYSEGGFTLDNTRGFLSPAEGNLFYSGTSATLMSFNGGKTKLYKEDGGAFNVESIEIIENPFFGTVPIEITFTGTKAGSPPVSKTFTTDGMPGPETLNLSDLSGSFTNLESLSWVQAGPAYHFDNITFGSSGPTTRADCMKGGWEAFGFRNQGDCVRFVETEKDRR